MRTSFCIKLKISLRKYKQKTAPTHKLTFYVNAADEITGPVPIDIVRTY